MNNWERITSDLGLAKLNESDIHPHCPEEKSHLFHSCDSGGTEFEFLNLINALALARKPEHCLETGTYTGFGTVAIAAALSWNGFGILRTIDIDPCEGARKMINGFGLQGHVDFIVKDALEYCQTYDGPPFEFVFIDSGSSRIDEANALIERKKLASGAIVVLHDASPLRTGMPNSWHHIFVDRCSLKGHTIELSRGLRIMFA